jgi:putative heme-binding domain-containing protein
VSWNAFVQKIAMQFLMRDRFFCVVLLLALFPASMRAEGPAAPPDRTAIAVEALTRLQGVDLEANPALKATLLRVLGNTRGTPQFVQLVKHFNLKDQNDGLLEVALKHAAAEEGIEAVRVLLASGGAPLIERTFLGSDTNAAVQLARALGNAGGKQSATLLGARVVDEASETGLRREATRALARNQDGAQELLRLAREDLLPEDLKFLAATELHAARWPQIKQEAVRALPLPAGRNAEPLPPMSELLKLKGNAGNGAKIYRREETACIHCHKVRGEGIEIGPDLSEIGSKLGREALIESILDPSAGISFGYEAWQIELKNGDEAYGLIVSETADELAVKNLQGFVTTYKKSEIARREKARLSIMPAGLQQSLSTQEFIDLIEYLASLKTP